MSLKALAIRVLSAACLVVYVGLLHDNHRLRERIGSLDSSLRTARRQLTSRLVQKGERFESLRVLDAKGELTLLDTRRRKGESLFVIVNPGCESCESLSTEVENYVRAGAPRPVAVVSIGAEEMTRSYAARHRLADVTYRLPDDVNPFVRERLSSVPQVFVVDARERVVRACQGLAECLAGPEVAAAMPGPDHR